MKLIISFTILSLSFCNFSKNQSNQNTDPERKEPEILLLKVTWIEGEATVIRDKTEIKINENLELEKEDLIKTGKNGTLELLLGLSHSIKLQNNTEISVTNLLTTEGDTATNISIFAGKILTNITNDEPKNLITLMTPNAQANMNNTILITEIITRNPKDLNCSDQSSCNTKFSLLDGTANIKQIGKNSEIILNEKFQISISSEEEITQNSILPLTKESNSEFSQMLFFHSEDQKTSEEILNEYKSELKPRLLPSIKKSVSVKLVPKIQTKAKNSIKKTPNLSLPKDRLKLDSNKKF